MRQFYCADRHQERPMRFIRQCTSISVHLLLVSALSGAYSPLFAASGEKEPAQRQIQGQERVLHALNRFTFGPRPGDVDAVERMGLKRWFDLQLNPSKIDDSALEQRLALFPAIEMSQPQMMERYPNPQMLREMIAKNLPLPSDPVEHAIYADEIAFYKTEKAKKQAEQNAASGTAATFDTKSGLAMLAGDGKAPSSMMANDSPEVSPVDIAMLDSLPPDTRMRRILELSPDQLVLLRRSLKGPDVEKLSMGLSPIQRETLAALQGPERLIGTELVESRMVRDIYSERQLQAVMTDFWLNHFNVYLRKNQHEPYLLPAFERDVIRPRALGKFEDLLVAVAESPAMLMYLDNWQSIGPDSRAAERGAKAGGTFSGTQGKQVAKSRGLNENYARELMELHTLGVGCEVSTDHSVKTLDKACGKGYTQQDVTVVAEVFTGWTVDQPERVGQFQFEEKKHEPGDKVVMSKTIRANGQNEGLELLHILATSPATAKFISTKMAVRFVEDTPSPVMINRMSKAYMKSGGDISAVFKAMYDSPEFWEAKSYRAKVKTPEEFVVSAMRASGAEVTNAGPLVQALDKLGMPFYGMQTPNGYSWTAETWVNTGDLLNRMNFAVGFSADRLRGVETRWPSLLQSQDMASSAANLAADDADAKERRLEVLLLGQPADDRTRAAVLAQLGQPIGSAEPLHDDRVGKAGKRIAGGGIAGMMLTSTRGAEHRQPMDPEAAAMAGLLIGSPEFQKR